MGRALPLLFMAGLFIVVEGLDGTGKSTHAKAIEDFLRQRGRRVVGTREPGATSIGMHLRALLLDPEADIHPWAEVLLYAADRAQHVATVIRPNLAAGVDVVCDRFVLSSLAYQGGGRELGVEAVSAVNAFAMDGIEHDLTVLLDMGPIAALERLDVTPDRIETESVAFYTRVRQAYLNLVADHGGAVVDAAAPLEVVRKEVLDLVAELLDRTQAGTP